MKDRAGRYINQSTGYRAFIPKPLPPEPPIRFDDELQSLLSKADIALARLDAITTVLPNPDLFIGMYVKKEALLSSQIEGTEASMQGILEFEANLIPKENIDEVKQVINYIKAMNYGLERIKEFPLSLRLIREIHKILLEGTRGNHRTPGEFKISQNWIGPPGSTIVNATYIPPPPDMMLSLMGDLEKYFYAEDKIPDLVRIALIHAQFETIHPFLDGNGRIGRLFITFYLIWKKILTKPTLYLSFYLKKNRTAYYDLLMKIRTDGDWEQWINFFLKGIYTTCDEATNTAHEIVKLKERLLTKIYENGITSIYAVRLLDLLFETPLISGTNAIHVLKISQVAINQLIRKFERIGILKEITGKKRYRKYIFKDYVDIITKGTELR
ncbi:Fic family protein [candidate division WOR-3 bacterium]|nr:Fic family protein [candidate division WOR-3 bacterium]